MSVRILLNDSSNWLTSMLSGMLLIIMLLFLSYCSRLLVEHTNSTSYCSNLLHLSLKTSFLSSNIFNYYIFQIINFFLEFSFNWIDRVFALNFQKLPKLIKEYLPNWKHLYQFEPYDNICNGSNKNHKQLHYLIGLSDPKIVLVYHNLVPLQM